MTQKFAYIFPGQGTQWVGMGRNLYNSSIQAREVFEEADQALDLPLSRLCFEGPEEDLCQTINAQPAILTLSLACLKSWERSDKPPPSFVAGHSLGEYTALVAAGVLDFASALRLVRKRGWLMQEAGERVPGGMVAVLGMDQASLEGVCQGSGAEIANINCPGQVVISGSKEALAYAVELAKAKGARRTIPLEVSGAFHSRLMQLTMEEMSQSVSALDFRDPVVPIVANTSAQPLTSAEAIKEELLRQLCCCVRWQESVEYMLKAGVSTFVEIGPGEVLTNLIRRIDRNAETLNIGEKKGD